MDRFDERTVTSKAAQITPNDDISKQTSAAGMGLSDDDDFKVDKRVGRATKFTTPQRPVQFVSVSESSKGGRKRHLLSDVEDEYDEPEFNSGNKKKKKRKSRSSSASLTQILIRKTGLRSPTKTATHRENSAAHYLVRIDGGFEKFGFLVRNDGDNYTLHNVGTTEVLHSGRTELSMENATDKIPFKFGEYLLTVESAFNPYNLTCTSTESIQNDPPMASGTTSELRSHMQASTTVQAKRRLDFTTPTKVPSTKTTQEEGSPNERYYHVNYNVGISEETTHYKYGGYLKVSNKSYICYSDLNGDEAFRGVVIEVSPEWFTLKNVIQLDNKTVCLIEEIERKTFEKYTKCTNSSTD